MLDFNFPHRAQRCITYDGICFYTLAKMYLDEAEIDRSQISEMTVKKC